MHFRPFSFLPFSVKENTKILSCFLFQFCPRIFIRVHECEYFLKYPLNIYLANNLITIIYTINNFISLIVNKNIANVNKNSFVDNIDILNGYYYFLTFLLLTLLGDSSWPWPLNKGQGICRSLPNRYQVIYFRVHNTFSYFCSIPPI